MSANESLPSEQAAKTKIESQPNSSRRRLGRKAAATLLAVSAAISGVDAAIIAARHNSKPTGEISRSLGRPSVTPESTTSTTIPETTTSTTPNIIHQTTSSTIKTRTAPSTEVLQGPRKIEQLPGYGKKVSEADKLSLQRATFRLWIKAKDGSEPNRPWGLLVEAYNGSKTFGITSTHLDDIAQGVQDPNPDGANIQKEYVWQTSAGMNSGVPAQDLSDKESPYEISVHELDDQDGSQPLAVVNHYAEDTSGKRNELSLVSFDHVTSDMENRALKGIKIGAPEPGEEVYLYGQATPSDAKQGVSMFAIGESFNDWAIKPAGPQELYNAAVPRGSDPIEPGYSGACGISASGFLVGGLRGVAHPGEGDHIAKVQQATNVDVMSGNKYDVAQFGVLDPETVANQLAVI